jgi:hypothetical protein
MIFLLTGATVQTSFLRESWNFKIYLGNFHWCWFCFNDLSIQILKNGKLLNAVRSHVNW